MKPLVKSRLVWVLAAVVAAQLALYLRRYLPAEQAAMLSDELVATLCAALGIGGIGLRVQDKKRARTAGDLVSAKAAKAAAKIGAGLSLALLCGCDRSADAALPLKAVAARPSSAPCARACRCSARSTDAASRRACPPFSVTRCRDEFWLQDSGVRRGGLPACLLAAAIVLFAGCSPTWQLCEVDLSNHPVKPRPAASARVRCSRTVLCDVAEGATCDGEVLAKGAK